MRWVAVVLCWLVAMPSVVEAAPGAVWRSRYVRVRAYVGADWLPIVEQGVADMNAVLPSHAPRLMLETQPPMPCKRARKQNAKAKRMIVICENPNMDDAGHTVADVADDVIQSPVILRLGAYPDDTWDVEFNTKRARNLVCHELMHAVSWAPEDVGNASCVSGPDFETFAPGPDDIAFLQRVYRKSR